jgi:hypothetical protein
MDAAALNPSAPAYPLSDEQRGFFAEEGYLVLNGAVAKESVAALRESVVGEYERKKREGELFSGGGQLSGHLNCFPGEGSRKIYGELKASGVIAAAKGLFPRATGEPNVGLNLNLPKSAAQHIHVDSVYADDFLILNIAVVDTRIENGAIELVPRTQKRFYRYWQYVLEGKQKGAIRVPMSQGDVLIRTSNLWHRGMPNLTEVPRPMMALTWEAGGTSQKDPFLLDGGKVTFHPNWFRPNALGRLRERIFVAAPFTYAALRIARSLVDKGY